MQALGFAPAVAKPAMENVMDNAAPLPPPAPIASGQTIEYAKEPALSMRLAYYRARQKLMKNVKHHVPNYIKEVIIRQSHQPQLEYISIPEEIEALKSVSACMKKRIARRRKAERIYEEFFNREQHAIDDCLQEHFFGKLFKRVKNPWHTS